MIRKSFCRICTSNCGLAVDVEGDQVISVQGDRDCALTQGYSCIKGRRAGELHHREDRLLHPKMRKDGVMQTVGWEEALDDLAARLKAIIAEHGKDAVGFFQGGGHYLDAGAYATAQSMRQVFGSKSIYSDMSIDVMSKGVVGEMMHVMGTARPDFGKTPLVLYVGTNPVVSHGHTSMLNNPTQRLREMTAEGEVWVLDPRHTETARKATRYLSTRPGTDFAVLAFLVRELLIDGADWDYIEAHATGVDELRAAVEPFDVAHASSWSGVPQGDLLDLLGAVRRHGRLSTECGTGISMSPAGNMVAWMQNVLMIVTGSLDREGGAWINPGFFLKLDERDIPGAPPEGWQMPGPPSRPDLRPVAGEYVCAAMPDEIESGNLRALINLSGHILTCMPHTPRFTAALAKLEVLATVEILDNDMANFSTHAFPAKDQLERVDVSLAVDPSFTTVGAMFTPAMVPARGEAKSFWWILCQLGKRLDMDFLPGVDPDSATDEQVIDMIAQGGRMPIDTSGDCNYTIAHERIYGWMLARADALGGFRLAPRMLVEQMAEMVPAAPLMLITRRTLNQHNSRKVEDRREIAAIYCSAADAAERGLADGDQAVVRSRHGEIRGIVRIDPRLSRGACSVPHGWAGQYNVNQLTSVTELDRITGMPIMSNLPVELLPVKTTVGEVAFATA